MHMRVLHILHYEFMSIAKATMTAGQIYGSLCKAGHGMVLQGTCSHSVYSNILCPARTLARLQSYICILTPVLRRSLWKF